MLLQPKQGRKVLTGCLRAIRFHLEGGDRFGVFVFFVFFPESLS